MVALLAAVGLLGAVATGTLTSSISCREHPSQRYALYLPAAAASDTPRPVLFIMDPRGRAVTALEIFLPALERHGWIGASSWNTASDGPGKVNVDAFNAVLPDLAARANFDPKRLYLAGFSGTARASWEFAYGLPGRIAGVIGAGAGLPEGRKAEANPPFDFFGTAGMTDFNYEEVRALEATLMKLQFPARFAFFDGGHQWMPEPLAARAIDWLEVRAMKRGLRRTDSFLATAILAKEASAAWALESKGEGVSAWEIWRALAADFEGLVDVSQARQHETTLRESREVDRWRSARKRQFADQVSFEKRLFDILDRFKGVQAPPSLRTATTALQITALRRKSLASDKEESAAANRLLNLLFVHASFYVPRELMEAGRTARALAILDLADAVKENHAGVCFERARALATLARTDEAFAALGCWAASPFAERSDLDTEKVFAALSVDPRFTTLRERLPAALPSP